MYKTLMAAAAFADWLTKIIMTAARKASIRASNIADKAETKAFNQRWAANHRKLDAAVLIAQAATANLDKQRAKFSAELKAISEAHPGH